MPIEYPENWIKEQHRFWNEQYLLQAFLSFNPAFEILWGGRYMHIYHSAKLATAFDCCYRSDLGFGCSFWIRRIDSDERR